MIVDIAAGYTPGRYGTGSPVDVVPLAELISITPRRREETWASMERLFEALYATTFQTHPAGHSVCGVGLSPHAPYTTDPALLQVAIERSNKHRLPLAMHLAETVAEVQWLESGVGEFAEMRSRFIQDGTAERFTSCEQILAFLTAAHRSLIIHGNYLSDTQLDQIAAHRNIAVVYCPRTAVAFGHPPHPIERCMARGINVFFGTDSRASNPDLRLLEDLKHVHASHPAIAPRSLWRAATTGPREFLDLPPDRGTLEVDSRGPLSVLRSDDQPTTHAGLYESFFSPSATATLFDLRAGSEVS